MIDLWNHINSYWSRLCKSLKCKLVFVFDGRRNASKAAENEKRKVESDACKANMETILCDGNFEARDTLLQKIRDCTYVREDVIACIKRFASENKIPYICAFMEADHKFQLFFFFKKTHNSYFI